MIRSYVRFGSRLETSSVTGGMCFVVCGSFCKHRCFFVGRTRTGSLSSDPVTFRLVAAYIESKI